MTLRRRLYVLRNRRRVRRQVWETLRYLGLDVVPEQDFNRWHGPILTEKGLTQARCHVEARTMPRGQG